MKKIAVIPARGGSKRIPKKNIIDFMGKPMMLWTIEAAQKSGLFDRIIVSTDDAEFAAVAKSYGCEVPFLRDTSADDITPVSVATMWSSRFTQFFLALIASISPLRTPNTVFLNSSNFVAVKMSFT